VKTTTECDDDDKAKAIDELVKEAQIMVNECCNNIFYF
jgi:hypothetical protein